MKKITFEMLYVVNVAWTKDTLLNVFFFNGEPYRAMTVEEVLTEYADWNVKFVNNDSLELEEAARG